MHDHDPKVRSGSDMYNGTRPIKKIAHWSTESGPTGSMMLLKDRRNRMRLVSTTFAVKSRARDWVATKLECNSTKRISLFETNIRIVGGLLGAFELAEDQMFLDKAQECVDLMLPIFETSASGMACCWTSCLCTVQAFTQLVKLQLQSLLAYLS